MMVDVKPVVIMAGGTGGHVYPALAVAYELRERGIPVVWLGTRSGLEAKLVPAAGFDIQWMNIGGLRGKGVAAYFMAPLRLILACIQAFTILNRVKPQAVLGMGGFASGPGGFVAWLLRKPLIIHEQNAVAGMTNRILSKMATHVLVAFPNTFNVPEQYVGNPVRKEILDIKSPEVRMQNNSGALKLLVVGGSLGAAKLNELVPESISKLADDERPEIIHQTGVRNYQHAKNSYNKANVKAKVEAYIEDMAQVYAWADLIICRAGALTISELANAGVAAILVPYPYAVDDHQTANAGYLTKSGAAILIQQDKLIPQLKDTLLGILQEGRSTLIKMAIAARKLSKPNATQQVAEICLGVAHG